MAAMLAFWIAAAQLVAARAAATNRSVSWWFDVAENQKTDAANAKAIADHRAAFSRVMPYNAKVTLDGNVSNWWGHDDDVAAWNAPLQKLGVPVLPYLIDTSNATEMHLVYANSTAAVADAVAIAEHYGFQGWFIDYEDEYPADSDPRKSEKLAAFLTELGDALHAEGMELAICVASWSGLLADYGTLANSSVDELQLMSTYANPSDSQSIIADYFAKIEATTGSTDKAGVGVGIYYDGRGGYDKDWTEETHTGPRFWGTTLLPRAAFLGFVLPLAGCTVRLAVSPLLECLAFYLTLLVGPLAGFLCLAFAFFLARALVSFDGFALPVLPFAAFRVLALF